MERNWFAPLAYIALAAALIIVYMPNCNESDPIETVEQTPDYPNFETDGDLDDDGIYDENQAVVGLAGLNSDRWYDNAIGINTNVFRWDPEETSLRATLDPYRPYSPDEWTMILLPDRNEPVIMLNGHAYVVVHLPTAEGQALVFGVANIGCITPVYASCWADLSYADQRDPKIVRYITDDLAEYSAIGLTYIKGQFYPANL